MNANKPPTPTRDPASAGDDFFQFVGALVREHCDLPLVGKRRQYLSVAARPQTSPATFL